jgi:kynurenine formamidase
MNMNINKMQLIDLTHTLTPDTRDWDGHCGFHLQMHKDYDKSAVGTAFRLHNIEMVAGIGTHMDAPMHCFAKGKSIADIRLQELFVPCVVIDMPENRPDDYCLLPKDIHEFETHVTKIEKNTFVIVRTGWAKHWHDPVRYRNDLVFPTISPLAATLLIEKGVVGIGIDTLSPDNATTDFKVHHIVLGAGKYIIENIANADRLPSYGAIICALPLKIKDGTEAPLRLVGIIPH